MWATVHAEHSTGSDHERETRQVRIATGHVDAPGKLRSLAEVAFPPRRAGGGGVRVPRQVLGSRAGRIVLAYRATRPEGRGEGLPGMLRVIDAGTGACTGEWASSRWPIDGPGRGLERYFATQLGHPVTLAADGASLLLRHGERRDWIVEVLLDGSLTELGERQVGRAGLLAAGDGWLVIDHEGTAERLGPGLRPGPKRTLPSDAGDHVACVTPDGETLVLPVRTGADFWLVGPGGEARRFHAHAGAGRSWLAELAVSDDGEWVASRHDRELMVTGVAEGVSWPVAELEPAVRDERYAGGSVVRETVPVGVAFIGNRLLVGDARGLREIPLTEGEGKAFVSECGRAGARTPVRVAPTMSFDELMVAARLEAQAATLRRLHSPAVSIEAVPLGRTGWKTAKVGASRFGGWPDLPAGVAWPTWQGRPMAFLAQVDLAQVAAAEPEVRLPARGLLSFFVGCLADTYLKDGDPRPRLMVDAMIGSGAAHGDGWRVLYTPAGPLERKVYAGAPLPELFDPHALRFAKGGLSLPDELTGIYDHLPLEAAQRDDYDELLAGLRAGDQPMAPQLMGYPTLIQRTPPEWMCELAATGRDPWSLPTLESAGVRALALAASEWTLLLQLVTAEPFEWGDAGNLYFYGDRRAMECGDFSRMWVYSECS